MKNRKERTWLGWICFALLLSGVLGLSPAWAATDAGAVFKPTPDMSTARMGHWNVTLPNGQVLLVGGHGSGFVSLTSSELWSANAKGASTLAMNFPHDMPAFARLNNGSYLIAGGSSDWGVPSYATSEIYNPRTDAFTPTGNMVRFRAGAGAAALTNGNVLVAGAWWGHNDAHTYGEIYSPKTGVFEATGPLNTPRAYPIVLPTSDGKAVVFGGIDYYGGSTVIEQVELYDPASNSFSVLADSLFASESGWQIQLNSYMRPMEAQQLADGSYLLLAARNNQGVYEYTLFTFDPKTKAFTKITTKPGLPDASIVALWPPVVDATRDKAYILAQLYGFDPLQVQILTLDTLKKTLALPKGSYTLPSGLYTGGMAMTLLRDGRIFMTGGTSDGSNFSPVVTTLSAAPFDIRVTSPSNGEAVPLGSTKMITWEYQGKPGAAVKVDLLLNGKLVQRLTTRTGIGSGGVGSFQWNIDPNLLPGSQYAIRVTSRNSPSCADISDKFEITAP